VYNPASSQVDARLMETSEAAAKLKWRLFPESYAMHWLKRRRTRLARFGLAGRTSAAIGRQSVCNQKLWFMASLC
jgi:hypothetical protein